MNKTLHSKPHTLKGIRITFPFKEAAPDWLLSAYKEGRAMATLSSEAKYITLYQGDNIQRGYEGQWLCINPSGSMFFLTQEEIERGFTGWE
jgi:hypothetical protein